MGSLKKRMLIALGAGALMVFTVMGVAVAGHTNTVLEADLNGRAEVGEGRAIAGDPNGSGEAYLFGIDGDARTLCYVLTVDKIETATAAHIHEGAAGANGPVVAALAVPGDGNAADCLTEGEAGKFPGNPPGIIQEILANPGDYYINVHNEAYPGGAIRGQLSFER